MFLDLFAGLLNENFKKSFLLKFSFYWESKKERERDKIILQLIVAKLVGLLGAFWMNWTLSFFRSLPLWDVSIMDVFEAMDAPLATLVLTFDVIDDGPTINGVYSFRLLFIIMISSSYYYLDVLFIYLYVDCLFVAVFRVFLFVFVWFVVIVIVVVVFKFVDKIYTDKKRERERWETEIYCIYIICCCTLFSFSLLLYYSEKKKFR